MIHVIGHLGSVDPTVTPFPFIAICTDEEGLFIYKDGERVPIDDSYVYDNPFLFDTPVLIPEGEEGGCILFYQNLFDEDANEPPLIHEYLSPVKEIELRAKLREKYSTLVVSSFLAAVAAPEAERSNMLGKVADYLHHMRYCNAVAVDVLILIIAGAVIRALAEKEVKFNLLYASNEILFRLEGTKFD